MAIENESPTFGEAAFSYNGRGLLSPSADAFHDIISASQRTNRVTFPPHCLLRSIIVKRILLAAPDVPPIPPVPGSGNSSAGKARWLPEGRGCPGRPKRRQSEPAGRDLKTPIKNLVNTYCNELTRRNTMRTWVAFSATYELTKPTDP